MQCATTTIVAISIGGIKAIATITVATISIDPVTVVVSIDPVTVVVSIVASAVATDAAGDDDVDIKEGVTATTRLVR
jgi:hypothetical protein